MTEFEAVRVAVGETDAVNDDVGLAVTLAVDVPVRDRVGVTVGEAVNDGDDVPDCVREAVNEGVAVLVGVCVAVPDLLGVEVCDGSAMSKRTKGENVKPLWPYVSKSVP